MKFHKWSYLFEVNKYVNYFRVWNTSTKFQHVLTWVVLYIVWQQPPLPRDVLVIMWLYLETTHGIRTDIPSLSSFRNLSTGFCDSFLFYIPVTLFLIRSCALVLASCGLYPIVVFISSTYRSGHLPLSPLPFIFSWTIYLSTPFVRMNRRPKHFSSAAV